MKLRLLLLKDCNRNCRGCCNKDWDLDALPVCKDYSPYSEFMLTGGEPMLKPEFVRDTITEIRRQSKAPIFIYTAMSNEPRLLLNALRQADGITLTLHVKRDARNFENVQNLFNMYARELEGKSLRLNVFSNVPTDGLDMTGWKVRSGIVWLKDCPLPTDEVFMRAP